VSETRAHDGSSTTATEHFSHISETAARSILLKAFTLQAHRFPALSFVAVLSNGHYSEPYVPYVPGLWSFPGTVVHSRWWRSPAQFDGKNVLIVGSHASGSDVCRELAVRDEQLAADGISVTRRITQSVRAGEKDAGAVEGERPGWLGRIHGVSEVGGVEGGVVVLKNGSRLEGVEVIVYATGYLYS